MTQLKAHPLFAVLVPVLVAAPSGAPHTIRIPCNQGVPTHVDPDYPLPASPHGALYALPWPATLTPAQAALCERVRGALASIAAERHTGALVVYLDPTGQPLARTGWQGRIPLAGAGRGNR